MSLYKIIAAYSSGELEKGDSLFESAGGELFAFRHGYDKLGRILSAMPQDHWKHSEIALCALVLYLAKYGKAARAQAHMLDHSLSFEKTVRFTISQLLVAIHLGDSIRDVDIERWILLERRLPICEPLTEGLYYNAMLVVLVRTGRLHDARSFGLRSISAYQTAKHTYLEHFIHLHLADLSIMEGHLRRGRRSLATARARLVSWGECYGNEAAIAEIIELALDYETGKFVHISAQSERLRRSLVKGDSWVEIFNQLGRISVMSLYFTAGRAVWPCWNWNCTKRIMLSATAGCQKHWPCWRLRWTGSIIYWEADITDWHNWMKGTCVVRSGRSCLAGLFRRLRVSRITWSRLQVRARR